MKRKKAWLVVSAAAFILCIGACAAIGLAIRFAPGLYTFFEQQNQLKVGSAAPDFTLRSLGGGSTQLSQFKGSPVVLTFGASWCPDCRAEAPMLQSLHKQHPELNVVLVDSRESDSVVKGFASEFGMTHLVLLDSDGRISDRYHIYAIPTSFFIDSTGTVRGMIIEQVTPSVIEEKLPLIGVEP